MLFRVWNMKQLLFILLICLSISANAQTQNKKQLTTTASMDSLVSVVRELKTYYVAASQLNNRFKLYSTQNMYNFLKLNTATGQITQIQWSTRSDNEGTVDYINSEDLTDGGGVPGRFELYPTQNIYAFLLVDTWNGRTWHVQWNINRDNRGIWRIY